MNPMKYTRDLPTEQDPFVPLPKHWPKRFNASNEPCDMLVGPCACGAWHSEGDIPSPIEEPKEHA